MMRHMLLALKIVLIVDSLKSDPAMSLTPHIALHVTAFVAVDGSVVLQNHCLDVFPYLIYYTSWIS